MSLCIRNLVHAVIVFGTLLLPLSPAAALEGFAVYEDWHEGVIRSSRWQGGEGFGGQEVGLEVTAAHRLELRYRHQGSTASNTGNIFTDQFLNTTNPAPITGMAAAFTVSSLSMTTCAANNSGSVTRARPARLVMAKFNDGSGSAVDSTGDHRAGVEVFRDGSSSDPDGVLKVRGFINRCSNPSCSVRPEVISATLPTTVSVGQSFTLRIKWDQPNHQFLFGVDGSADTALPYSVSDAAAAITGFVNIDVGHTTANCTAGAVAIDSTTQVGTVQTKVGQGTPPRLVNISTRGLVEMGDDVMIGGFVIGGSMPKRVLVRAAGPSLANFGVPRVLANPFLQIFAGSTAIAENDDWQVTRPLCQTSGFTCGSPSDVEATGLAPADPQESAILITLLPGPYTAIVSGAGGATGVGIVEVFEVDSSSASSPLVNISTRGLVEVGDDVMIGGFVIDGSSPKRVLVRAAGPSLANFGVPGVLANPFLQIFAGSTAIAENDDWQVTLPLCQTSGFTCGDPSDIGATGLAPTDPQESAILITLPPGPYTAIVSGAGIPRVSQSWRCSTSNDRPAGYKFRG